ncbi:unnamed protein product [Candidula unifasciata]|uniref:Peptidase S1 domain-containing protein n=1 Tax=Candidula unifasciata TaxID=100452 RepID=A0A8S3ZYU4_9EUPU|nr:unnamed protein product [Candidula unifasciata]
MQYLNPNFIVQIFIVALNLRYVFSQTISNPLVTNATTINDLQYVLGPNYRLFIAAYWLYLRSPCDILALKMAEDVSSRRLEKYCKVVNRCPQLYSTQSCLVQMSVYALTLACCSETSIPDHSKTVNTTFSLVDQQTCNYGRVFPSGKIFGGTEARRGEFPWIGMLLINGVFKCECTVLDAYHVMTAAHCFDGHIESNRYEIIAGKYITSLEERDPTEQRRDVSSFVIHEDYDKAVMSNDIAMLKLAQPLEFNESVLPACLPSPTDTLEQICTVAGWGKTEDIDPPSVLMKVELQVYNRTQCFNEFHITATDLGKYLHTGNICAANGKLGGKDACKGDSGSPLMCVKRTPNSAAWFVVGIVSNGNNCALPGEPGIYINTQQYLAWINTTIYSMS